MSLSDGINSMKSVQYSFEQINGTSEYEMSKQFGHSGVKGLLFQRKAANAGQSMKDTKEYQQNLLANEVGYRNYRELGEALRKGKVTNNEVVNSLRELEDKGLIKPENFIVEKKGSLSDKIGGLKNNSDSRTMFAQNKDIQKKLLRNELDSYAAEKGFVDKNNNPNTLLFLQSVESGTYQDDRAEALVDQYKSAFDTVGFLTEDFTDFKNKNGLTQGKYTIDDISDRIKKRF